MPRRPKKPIDWDKILAEIPYTIPWWRRLIWSLKRFPYKLLTRVNSVVDLAEWQCKGNMIVYVRTLLPALGEFVLGLLAFDWDDVARGALRPAGISSRRWLILGTAKAKSKLEIPEIGEEIGKRLPGVKIIKHSRAWRATRFLWVLDGLMQRWLYYYLLIDLYSEFVYNWCTGVLRAPEECGAALVLRNGTYGDHGKTGFHTLPITGVWCEVVSEPGPEAGFQWSAGTIIPQRPVAILSAWRLESAFPLGCTLKWRMGVRDLIGHRIVDWSPPAWTTKSEAETIITVFRVQPGGKYDIIADIMESN
jgi:hypothetical protein